MRFYEYRRVLDMVRTPLYTYAFKKCRPLLEVVARCRMRRHIFKQTFFMDWFVLVSNKNTSVLPQGRLILRMYCMYFALESLSQIRVTSLENRQKWNVVLIKKKKCVP